MDPGSDHVASAQGGEASEPPKANVAFVKKNRSQMIRKRATDGTCRHSGRRLFISVAAPEEDDETSVVRKAKEVKGLVSSTKCVERHVLHASQLNIQARDIQACRCAPHVRVDPIGQAGGARGRGSHVRHSCACIEPT